MSQALWLTGPGSHIFAWQLRSSFLFDQQLMHEYTEVPGWF